MAPIRFSLGAQRQIDCSGGERNERGLTLDLMEAFKSMEIENTCQEQKYMFCYQ